MASIRIIKRRIKSAKNISQVTKALEMVSAVKMRKAQEAALAGKPYTSELRNVLSELGGKVESDVHPFLNKPEKISKVTMVVIGTEKGLAGALVTNLARKVWNIKQQIEKHELSLNEETHEKIVLEKDVEVSAISWGKKAKEMLKKTGWKIVADFTTKTGDSLDDQIKTLSSLLSKSYLDKETDLILIAYSNFVNTMTQKPAVVQFLPMVSTTTMQDLARASSTIVSFEPSPKIVLDSLLQHYLITTMRQIVLDGLAAEHSARMVAMKNANDNARDIIKNLTLTYNQTRQSAITNEIADIVSGSMVSA